MSGSDESPLESMVVRRTLLAFIVVPPIASVLGAELGVFDVQSSIVAMVSAVLVLLGLQLELTLKDRSDRRREVRPFRNDDEAVPFLAQKVEIEKPGQVDLLEYSGFGAMPLLAKLGEVGSTRRLRLLVAHPDAAISDYQRDYRLAEALRALAYRIPEARAREIGLQIKCYRESASMRGRLVGQSYLALGWYSFDDRGLASSGEAQISGASNALIGVELRHVTGEALIPLFVKVFDNLWTVADQPDEAWEPHRKALPQLPTRSWLQSVRAQNG